MRILNVVLVSTCKVYWKSCYNKIKRRAYFVKHSINDLAGLLSTPRFFCPNRGVLKRPAKSFIVRHLTSNYVNDVIVRVVNLNC